MLPYVNVYQDILEIQTMNDSVAVRLNVQLIMNVNQVKFVPTTNVRIRVDRIVDYVVIMHSVVRKNIQLFADVWMVLKAIPWLDVDESIIVPNRCVIEPEFVLTRYLDLNVCVHRTRVSVHHMENLVAVDRTNVPMVIPIVHQVPYVNQTNKAC